MLLKLIVCELLGFLNLMILFVVDSPLFNHHLIIISLSFYLFKKHLFDQKI